MAHQAKQGRYDRERVEALVRRLNALKLGSEGRVALLVESPTSGRHERREQVEVLHGKGFAGDYERKDFYKGRRVPGREVSAISAEVLAALGVEDPAVVGDNIVTEGIDLAALTPGDQLLLGVVRLVRSERPHQPCTAFRKRTTPEAFAAISRAERRGALFTVERGGTLRIGTAIRQLPAQPSAPEREA